MKKPKPSTRRLFTIVRPIDGKLLTQSQRTPQQVFDVLYSRHEPASKLNRLVTFLDEAKPGAMFAFGTMRLIVREKPKDRIYY